MPIHRSALNDVDLDSVLCLLSLGARRYSTGALHSLAQWQRRSGRSIVFISLDRQEATNEHVLGHYKKDQKISSELVSSVDWPGPVTLISSREIFFSDLPLKELEIRIFERYRTELGFKKTVLQGVYRSLHPIFKRLSVKNQRDPFVDALAPYLLSEAALLTRLYEIGFRTEVGFHERGLIFDRLAEDGWGFPQLELLSVGEQGKMELVLDKVQVDIPNSRRSVGPISASVSGGQILAIVGPNGSGKSSLLRTIAGHVNHRAGSIFIANCNVGSKSPFDRKVSSVFQDSGLIQTLTTNGNISMGIGAAKLRGVKPLDARSLLEAFGLARISQTRADKISGGERQIVSVVRAMASGAACILLDEPTASLDAPRRRLLASILREFVAENSVACVLVSHDVEFVFSLADKILCLGADGSQRSFSDAGSLSNGGFGIVSSELLGAPNVFNITSESDGVRLDDWVKIAGLTPKPDAVGVRFPLKALTVTSIGGNAESWAPRSRRPFIVGTLLMRRFRPGTDQVILEPACISAAGVKIGRARMISMPEGATKSLPSMKVVIEIDEDQVVWLS